ncbi:MAG: DUF116 domain-containing protein [Candidatus Methanomethylicia archaeon]
MWRIIDTGLRSAAENMALDNVILEAVSRNKAPNTIRFLRFLKPCVLVGYHQDVDQEVRVDYCVMNDIEINRRITGGGAIYFHPSHLGWEVISSWSYLFPRDIEDLYGFICKPIVEALRRIGLNARFRPRNDIEVNGKKISGTGGTTRNNAFLFQGTLLTDLDVREMLKCLKIPIKKLSDKDVDSLKDRVTTVRWELNYMPDLEFIKSIIVEEICKHFNVDAEYSNLTDFELQLLREQKSYFRSSSWIYLVKVPKRGLFHSSIKVSGGLIRAAVSIRENIIQSIFITGDFFTYPQTLINELECRLKHTLLDELELLNIVENVFTDLNATIPGVLPQDIVKAIINAASKIHLLDLGLTEDEANSIIEVLKPINYTLPNANYILLPYCAKPVECIYRYDTVCVKCGLCEFTLIHKAAERFGFKPITIVNYEHLEETLIRLRDIGEKAWIGCCCEAFYEKHFEDFKNIGLPGLIVTVEGITCYDLGLEKLAYEGKYDGLSKLRVDLLIKIFKLSDSMKMIKAKSTCPVA